MSNQSINLVEEANPIAGTPVLDRINYPVIEIKNRMIHIELDAADSTKINLTFQPYQAFKLTTQDCYRDQGATSSDDRLFYQSTSDWLNELKTTLGKNDPTANFMDKALHFIIPAGDDVLEIAAWKVEITYADKTTVFPEGVTTFPF